MCSEKVKSMNIISQQLAQMEKTVSTLQKTFERFIGFVTNGESTLAQSECFDDD
jgi:hypothetical protein